MFRHRLASQKVWRLRETPRVDYVRRAKLLDASLHAERMGQHKSLNDNNISPKENLRWLTLICSLLGGTVRHKVATSSISCLSNVMPVSKYFVSIIEATGLTIVRRQLAERLTP